MQGRYFVPALIALIGLSLVGATTVEQAALAGGCSTSVVNGLSQQLIDEILCMAPGVLKKISNSRFSLGSAAFPYLQTNAANALVDVVNSKKTTLTINSALRTLPQQYLLYRWKNLGLCGITAAAAPGRSNHNGGLAVDVNSYSSWINTMSAHNWEWFGDGDKPHFTYVGSGTRDINSLSTKAFQRLWNRNNPSDQISEDGVYGPNTERRLQKSPTSGFTTGASCKRNEYHSEKNVPAVAKQVIGESCDTLNGTGTCINATDCLGTFYGGYCVGFPAYVGCCVPGVQGYSTYSTNTEGVNLIKSYEGFEPNFYYDSVGIKTIGYGHACHVSDCSELMAKTSYGTWYEVYAPLTESQATDLLRGDLEKGGYETCVRTKVTRTSGFNSDQFSSLVSFVFNVGCSGFGSSTLLKRVNADAPLEGTGGIREAFLMWNKAGGKTLTGLTRRRNAEADLYGEGGGNGVSLPYFNPTPAPSSGSGSEYVGDDCWYNSQKGVCMDYSDCSGTSVRGLCGGPSNIRCCLNDKCNYNSINDGVCKLTSLCTTSYKSGKCLGAWDIKCCKLSSYKQESLNDEENPPDVPCPDGATFNDVTRFCEDDDWVYGPFTQAMVEYCQIAGKISQCTDTVEVQVRGHSLKIPRWPKGADFNDTRGDNDCPRGSLRSQTAVGECLEALGDNSTDTANFTSMAVYGGFNVSFSEECEAQSGGAACWSTRWGFKYYASIVQPRLEFNVETSDTEFTVDETLTDYSNPFIYDQSQFSSQVEGNTNGASSIVGLGATTSVLVGCLAALLF